MKPTKQLSARAFGKLSYGMAEAYGFGYGLLPKTKSIKQRKTICGNDYCNKTSYGYMYCNTHKESE